MSKPRLSAMAATTALVLAAAAPAHAVILAPGDSSNFPDSLTDIGTPIDSISGTFVSTMGASDFSGTYTEDVIRGNQFGANDLSWFIQVTNNPMAGAEGRRLAFAAETGDTSAKKKGRICAFA